LYKVTNDLTLFFCLEGERKVIFHR
jgi:hypothetical protein